MRSCSSPASCGSSSCSLRRAELSVRRYGAAIDQMAAPPSKGERGGSSTKRGWLPRSTPPLTVPPAAGGVRGGVRGGHWPVPLATMHSAVRVTHDSANCLTAAPTTPPEQRLHPGRQRNPPLGKVAPTNSGGERTQASCADAAPALSALLYVPSLTTSPSTTILGTNPWIFSMLAPPPSHVQALRPSEPLGTRWSAPHLQNPAMQHTSSPSTLKLTVKYKRLLSGYKLTVNSDREGVAGYLQRRLTCAAGWIA